MSKAEALAQAYHVTGSNLVLLENECGGGEKVLKLPYALIERLREEARSLGWEFVAAATFGPVIRLYYRNSKSLFTEDFPFFDDAPLVIFRDLVSHKPKLSIKGSV